MTDQPSHALTLVAPAESEALRAAVSSVQTLPPLEGAILRDLNPNGEEFALEAKIALSDATEDTGLRAELTGRFDGLADWALLPLENRRKRILICDMDSTIIGQECLDELADYAGLKAEIAAITERAMRGELDFEGALTTRVAMLKGLGLDALERCYTERISLNPGARDLVETMKADGAETLLVSGGFTFFTSRVAEAAGFAGNRGNTLLDDGATLTGEVGRPILGREAKLTALQEAAATRGLSLDDAVAIGDGANDLAMIEAAGMGIAYRAKPIVAERADAAINLSSLRAALYFQGYALS